MSQVNPFWKRGCGLGCDCANAGMGVGPGQDRGGPHLAVGRSPPAGPLCWLSPASISLCFGPAVFSVLFTCFSLPISGLCLCLLSPGVPSQSLFQSVPPPPPHPTRRSPSYILRPASSPVPELPDSKHSGTTSALNPKFCQLNRSLWLPRLLLTWGEAGERSRRLRG